MTTYNLQEFDYELPSEDEVEEAIALKVAGFKQAFGDRLAQVWLHGSRARGAHRPDSDVDLVIAIREHPPHHEVFDLIASVQVPIWLSHRVLIESHPTTLERLEHSDDDFHHSVRAEGRRVDG